VDGTFVRLTGQVAGPPGEIVLRRTEGGEIQRRSFELELDDRGRQRIDTRSPWLVLVGRAIRQGQRVTVDGVPTLTPRQEALYREAATRPALEALRVAPGAWPELGLLRLPCALAALLLLTALVFPSLVRIQIFAQHAPAPRELPPPEIRHACPVGTRVAGRDLDRWCETGEGRRHGPAVSYWSPSQIRSRGEFRDGELHGTWVEHDWAGQPRSHRVFDRGQRVGCWRLWLGASLQVRECYQADHAEGIFERWSSLGKLVEQGSYHEGHKHGLWKVWSDEGFLLREGSYHAGRRHGPWRFWNQDGGRAALGSYRNGAHDGHWRFWHETGYPAGHGRYRRGEKVGRWTAYYPSGRLAAFATYRPGKRSSILAWREEDWLAAER
jgi:antitoxin component YwqK of YwqJK toxin-antitoxin module